MNRVTDGPFSLTEPLGGVRLRRKRGGRAGRGWGGIGLALLLSWRGKLFGGLDCWGLELFDFPTDEIVDLDVRKVIEPNSP